MSRDEPWAAARESVAGRVLLAGLEAELLEDDPCLRLRLFELAALLRGWKATGDAVVLIHLGLIGGCEGYTEADLATARADYRSTRDEVLSRIAELNPDRPIGDPNAEDR